MTKVYFEHTAIKIRIMQTNEYGFESRYQHYIICFGCVVLEAGEGGLVKILFCNGMSASYTWREIVS